MHYIKTQIDKILFFLDLNDGQVNDSIDADSDTGT